ncbi:hypothetical protein A3A67_01480 [Candidatus Peribacteria bacterium RIFCSPLOWO2_01_FULL_51_18]|nr:MAG: hypothetical protein A3C52_03070 [Candidatus Peribacteria bacterium RIFCSPHIGHO2_02_FULL_51_15]OGJ65374.1 MAG: hypothetical protein A3A67_01480 [Candidatus Peribacteria bacterium RIFCSPLOWO2_01_FULL_51_18]OGJ69599.1 MAG: hypothetical protein A3J34_00150 [Candidatus Peribacteria bacterium RIFCSPLOWO2_02_FULL_51_10]
MKKLSFLLGTLGGAMAGYIFSNGKLRKELMNTKDAAAAAKVLGKHLAVDGQTVAREVQKIAKDHHFEEKINEGKKYARKYYDSAKKELTKFVGMQAKNVSNSAKKAGKSAVKKVKSMVK